MPGERRRADVAEPTPSDRPGAPAGTAASTGRSDADERTVAVTGDEAEELLELLSDGYTRRILEALAGDALPARSVVAACDTSRATIYRRLNRLQEYDLVAVDTELHPDGHHRKVFAKLFERATVELVDGTPEIRLVVRGRGTERGDPHSGVVAD